MTKNEDKVNNKSGVYDFLFSYAYIVVTNIFYNQAFSIDLFVVYRD